MQVEISSRGGRGRRKPRVLRELNGNAGKRPLPIEPKLEPCAPAPPEDLEGEARAEWDRIVPELLALGLLTRIDRSALVGYCEAWGEVRECQAVIRAGGRTYETSIGQICTRPEVKIRDAAWGRVLRFLGEFGLSPSSRSKVTQVKKPEAADGA